MRCPKCGSSNCSVHVGTESISKGYSVSKGCCCTILFGPIGLLAGLCGMKSRTFSYEFWICNDCGAKFLQSQGIAEPPVKLVYYYENAGAFPELKSDERLAGFTKCYEEHVLNTALYSHMIIRDSGHPIFDKNKEKCRKDIDGKVILFSLEYGAGMTVLLAGIVVGSHYIPKQNMICMRFWNTIYVNQYYIECQNEAEAQCVMSLLRKIYGEGCECGEYVEYRQVLEGIERHSYEIEEVEEAYPNADQYQAYVDRLLQSECVYFKQHYPMEPDPVRRLEEEDALITKMLKWIAGIGIAFGVIGLLTRGFWAGVLLAVLGGVGTLIVFLIMNYNELADKTSNIPERIKVLWKEQKAEKKKGVVKAAWENEVGSWYSGKEQPDNGAAANAGTQAGGVSYCPHCGCQVHAGTLFCPNCGSKLIK